VRRYLHVDSWIGLRFTGEAAMDYGNACFTGVFDTMDTRDWSDRWCGYFGIERGWLPSARSGDMTLGGLRREVAQQLNLLPGLPVKLGTADTSSALLAARIELGDLLHIVGTTQVLAVRTVKPRPAADHLTRLLGVGDGYVHITHNPVGGVALDWMHQLCFHDQTAAEFYAQSIPAAIARQTEVLLDPPYLGGDRLQIEERRAAFRELTIAHERLDLLAAVLTAMRTHHAQATAVVADGQAFKRIVLTGGGATIAQQVIYDRDARAVEMIEEASLRGVARLFSV
jgi:sugar (pentulose or hexulose) kinase